MEQAWLLWLEVRWFLTGRTLKEEREMGRPRGAASELLLQSGQLRMRTSVVTTDAARPTVARQTCDSHVWPRRLEVIRQPRYLARMLQHRVLCPDTKAGSQDLVQSVGRKRRTTRGA
jgi:hypothetical protein